MASSMWNPALTSEMQNFFPIPSHPAIPTTTVPTQSPPVMDPQMVLPLSTSAEKFIQDICRPEPVPTDPFQEYPDPNTPQSLVSDPKSPLYPSAGGAHPMDLPSSVPDPFLPMDRPHESLIPAETRPPEPAPSTAARPTNARSQRTSAQGEKVRIDVLNPRAKYDKVQKKTGPGGKYSQQRVADGQVTMCISSTVLIKSINIFVQRTQEALKKLLNKGTAASQGYDLPPVMFPAADVKLTSLNTGLQLNPVLTIQCELDLDSVYRHPEEREGREVYKLERTNGEMYNRFQLMVVITYEDNTHEALVPYDFVLKSGRTPATPSGGNQAGQAYYQQPQQPTCSPPRLVTYHLEAETAKIKHLEVGLWKTYQHDIAYNFIKVKKEETQTFEEGDVVGFFDRNGERTVIDYLTEENSHQAHMAGVISRHAYIEGNTGLGQEEGEETDLVCIIGQIKIKVSGKVKNGDLIYASSCDRYPGTAVSQSQLSSEGNRCHTLLGYALESSNDTGVSLVDCLVSIVLGITTKDQKRALRDLISNVENVRNQMNRLDDRFAKTRKNRKVRMKKVLALFSFLLVAGILCYVFLAPNSPYIKGRCEKGRSRSQGKLTYVFYPKDTEEEHQTITGIEFRWPKIREKLKLPYKKMNGTGNRYFLNMNRCLTGGVRRIARWLDPSPKILPINVLAVNANCTTVYFYSREESNWKPFSTAQASQISCSPTNGGKRNRRGIGLWLEERDKQ